MRCLPQHHFYMIGSGEQSVGDGESRRKPVRRPRCFWAHDVKHGNVVNKATGMLDCAADANIGTDAKTVHDLVH
jgi:hypothetical protein